MNVTILEYSRPFDKPHISSFKIRQNLLKWTCKTAYLVICSSGGVPATSTLGSEFVLSTGAPADAVGEVAAAGGQTKEEKAVLITSLISHMSQSLTFPVGTHAKFWPH